MIQSAMTKSNFWTGLTGLLAATSILLAIVLLLQTLFLSRPAEVQIGDASLPDVGSELQQVALNQEDLEAYASILERPLFFPDRSLPEIVGVDGEEEEEPENAEVNELDARLAGVIITPDRRIAMVTDGKTRKTTVMKEGMSLDGEQAAWQLSEIGARSVSFAAGERTAELELKVNTRGLQAPGSGGSRPNRAASAPNAAANNSNRVAQATNNTAVNSAAEVRRRIAERRAKLRAAREQQQANSRSDEDE